MKLISSSDIGILLCETKMTNETDSSWFGGTSKFKVSLKTGSLVPS